MRNRESNPLLEALARSQQTKVCLEAGMLTAFVEGTLLSREREAVLEHLGVCSACRNILRMATEVTPREVVPVKLPLVMKKQTSRVRVWMPWGVAIAATIVGAAILTLRHGQRTGEQSQVAINHPIQEIPFAPSSQSAEKNSIPPPVKSDLRLSTAQASHVAEQQPAESVSAGQVIQAPYADKEKAASSNKKSDTVAQDYSNAAKQAEVRGAAVMARAIVAAPIAKAHPQPYWRLNDMGQPVRVGNDGTSELVAVPDNARVHVLSVLGNAVWINTEKQRLYCSLDNGATWHAVALSEKSGTRHQIVRIKSPAQGTIVIEASDGTTWVSTDNGKSWN